MRVVGMSDAAGMPWPEPADTTPTGELSAAERAVRAEFEPLLHVGGTLQELANLFPPEDVIRAVQGMHGGCSRADALRIIARDVRDLTALRDGTGRP